MVLITVVNSNIRSATYVFISPTAVELVGSSPARKNPPCVIA